MNGPGYVDTLLLVADGDQLAGVRPLGPIGVARNGTCPICGTEGKLSDTHFPPKGAGNTEPSTRVAQAGTPDGERKLVPGRTLENGMRAYLVCADCNNHFGNDYDPAFNAFWARLWNLLIVEGKLPVIGAWARVQLENAPMGAMVRSAVAGFLGMNPEIGVKFPALLYSVRDDVPVTLPQGVHLLFGYYGGPDRWVHNGAFTPRFGPKFELAVSYGMLAWPPFFLVITDDISVRQWPGCPDLLPYLEWETTERRTVQIQAPRVQVDHPMRPVFSSDAGDVTVREMPGGGHIVEVRRPDA